MYSCLICGAAVFEDKRLRHGEWHAELVAARPGAVDPTVRNQIVGPEYDPSPESAAGGMTTSQPDCPTCGQPRHRHPGQWTVLSLVVVIIASSVYGYYWKSIWACTAAFTATAFFGMFYSEWLSRHRRREEMDS